MPGRLPMSDLDMEKKTVAMFPSASNESVNILMALPEKELLRVATACSSEAEIEI